MVDNSGKRIAFVQASVHKEIVDQSREAFVAKVVELGVSRDQIDFYEVPGSLEIPLHSKLLAKTGRYAVIVAAGLIVNGGIYRHEFVAETVIDGMMQVQLETEVPIISTVLTPINFHENEEHKNFFHEHFKVKGEESAVACVKTLENLNIVAQLCESE